MRRGEDAEFTGEILRDDLGIKETRSAEEALTPLNQVPDYLFERRDFSLLLLARKEEPKPLDPKLLELAELSLEAYRRLLEELHEYRGEEYGKDVKVVGRIGVSPVGPEGRYSVNFSTTNLQGEDDPQVVVSTFIFDRTPSKLDESYPAREENWVVGRQDGKLQVVGNYKELHDASGGKLAERLKVDGWTDISEIWAADVNRHAGFLRHEA